MTTTKANLKGRGQDLGKPSQLLMTRKLKVEITSEDPTCKRSKGLRTNEAREKLDYYVVRQICNIIIFNGGEH